MGGGKAKVPEISTQLCTILADLRADFDAELQSSDIQATSKSTVTIRGINKIYDAIHEVQQAFLALLQLCEADEVGGGALRLEMLGILKEKLRLVLNTFTESKRFKILLDELCNATAVPAASDHAAAMHAGVTASVR